MKEWQKLLEAIVDIQISEAKQIIESWIEIHDHKSMMLDLLNPMLHEMGRMWTEDFASMAHAYVAADVTRYGLDLFMAQQEEDASVYPDKGPVVLGNIEDDCHALGRQMVSTFLEVDGWKVHDLGVDIEPIMFVDEAVKTGARVIGVSAMIYSTAKNVRFVREEIDRRGLTDQIKLAAGGAVFRLRPELLEEVGADGSSEDAFGATELFGQLWKQTLPKETAHA